MEDIITFDKLKVGQMAKVYRIKKLNPALRRRIMDMGIVKGIVIKVVKVAPLGDPIEILLRGYNLSIRKEDLAMIEGEIIKSNKKLIERER